MGSSISKSPLERRKSVLRRSQKRAIIQTIVQIEKLQKEIKRFKGVDEDEDYNHLKTKIEHYTRDISRKSNDTIPELKVLHTKAQDMLGQAEKLLVSKLQENIDKDTEKKLKKDKSKNKEYEEHANNDEGEHKECASDDMDEVTIEDLEQQRDGAISPLSNISSLNEQNSYLSSNNKRNTVELTSVRIESKETLTELEKSPKEKRKSILKYGVQVLPGLNNQMLPRHSTNLPSPPSSPKQSGVEFAPEEDAKLMEVIKAKVIETEEEISQFEGKKNGMKYTKLQEQLFCYLDQLLQIHNKDDKGYIQLKRYVECCLSFLDEKAETNNDDEVFLPDTPRSINGFKITSI